MILTVTLNPAVDNALFLPQLKVGDTNRISRVDRDAGGKGINQSRVIHSLGGKTLATGFLGGPEGTFIRSVLDRDEIPHDFVWTVEPTRANFSVEDETKSPPTTFNLPGPAIAEEDWQHLVARCRDLAPRSSWVSLAGSHPRGIPIHAYRMLVELFQAAGVRVMLDADDEPMMEGLKARPDFIKPNEREASRLLDREVASNQDAIRAAQDLLSFCAPGGFVVLSRGAKGAILATAEGTWVGRSPAVEVRSTMGSGDSMIAGILWALEQDEPLPTAFAWGLASGAATAATDGTKIASGASIRDLVGLAAVEPA